MGDVEEGLEMQYHSEIIGDVITPYNSRFKNEIYHQSWFTVVTAEFQTAILRMNLVKVNKEINSNLIDLIS